MNSSLVQKTLTRLTEDFDCLNRRYGVLTQEQMPVLLKDIKYLLLDNIARGVKLIFYNPDKPEQIYLEYVYTLEGLSESFNVLDETVGEFLADIAFNVFIEFTGPFLTLDKEIQTLLLNNTEFDWYSYS